MTTPRQAIPVTSEQITALAEQLHEWTERLKKVAAIAANQPSETLAIYNWASVPKGLQLLGSFIEKADESRRQAILGKPLSVGQLKPRSTARKQADDEFAAELAELEPGMAQAQRKAAKGTPGITKKKKA